MPAMTVTDTTNKNMSLLRVPRKGSTPKDDLDLTSSSNHEHKRHIRVSSDESLGFRSDHHQRGKRTLHRPKVRGDTIAVSDGKMVQGGSFQRALPGRCSSFKGLSRPTVRRRTLPDRARTFNAKSEKVVDGDAKIMYMGRELNAAKTFANARARSQSPGGYFRRTKSEENNLCNLETQPKSKFQRALPGRVSSFKGVSRPTLARGRTLPARTGSFGSHEAVAKAMKLPKRIASRSELLRAASARSDNVEVLVQGFQRFKVNDKDVENIVNDPEYFRNLKATLKHNGVVTNGVLMQQLPLFNNHHKNYVKNGGIGTKSEQSGED